MTVTEYENTTASVTEVAEVIDGFKANDLALYSSYQGDSFEDRLAISRAITNSTALAESLGEVLQVANVVIHAVEVKDTETGEMVEQARTVLIDVEGNAYHAISGVIVKRLRDIIGVIGEPSTWPAEGVAMVCTRVKGDGANFFYDLRIV